MPAPGLRTAAQGVKEGRRQILDRGERLEVAGPPEGFGRSSQPGDRLRPLSSHTLSERQLPEHPPLQGWKAGDLGAFAQCLETDRRGSRLAEGVLAYRQVEGCPSCERAGAGFQRALRAFQKGPRAFELAQIEERHPLSEVQMAPGQGRETAGISCRGIDRRQSLRQQAVAVDGAQYVCDLTPHGKMAGGGCGVSGEPGLAPAREDLTLGELARAFWSNPGELDRGGPVSAESGLGQTLRGGPLQVRRSGCAADSCQTAVGLASPRRTPIDREVIVPGVPGEVIQRKIFEDEGAIEQSFGVSPIDRNGPIGGIQGSEQRKRVVGSLRHHEVST
jgi:hypothetical protein